MFNNEANCPHCIHSSICQYKSEILKIYDKIGEEWENNNTPDIFALKLDCKEFKLDTRVREVPLELIVK